MDPNPHRIPRLNTKVDDYNQTQQKENEHTLMYWKSIFFQSTTKTGWQNKSNVRNSYERNRRWHRNWGHYNSSVALHIHNKLQLLFHNIKTRRITGMVKNIFSIQLKNHPSLVGLQEGNWGSPKTVASFHPDIKLNYQNADSNQNKVAENFVSG